MKRKEKSRSQKLDQFFTKPEIAKRLYTKTSKIVEELTISSDRWLEPSAGSGAFFNLLPEGKRDGFDLEPKSEGVCKKDFLKVKLDRVDYLTIGNPPFGKNSSLAIKFFNKCADYSVLIAFIVPRTFKKTSVINKLDKRFEKVHEEDLQEFSFTLDGSDYNVPCVFQIWRKSDTLRPIIQTVTAHKDFEFATPDVADFAIQRVGVNAGSVKPEFSKCASESHYFIKVANEDTREAVQQTMNAVNWDEVKYNTAGNPSISKHEMVDLYQKQKDLTANRNDSNAL